MKLTILLLSILISFSSYAEWVKLGESAAGDSYYINSDMINRFKDSVTFRTMSNYIESSVYGDKSTITKRRADCNTYKYKDQAFYSYKREMGKGTEQEYKPRAEWYDAPKTSIIRLAIDYVCNFDKKGKNQDLSSYSSSNNAVKVDTKKQKSVSINYKKDLEAIKDLFESGLITKEDYDKQKQKILDRI